MKKLILITTAITLTVIFSSCLISLSPLVDINNVLAFDNCIGKWKDENSGTTIKIEKLIGSEADQLFAEQFGKKTLEKKVTEMDKKEAAATKASYVLTYKNEENTTHMMLLLFTKINGDWYVQTTRLAAILNKGEGGESSLYSPFEDDPTYIFAKVSKATSQNLEFSFPDKEKIKALIQDGKMGLKSESDDLFNNYLVTASTSQLNLFFTKYGKDKRLYNNNGGEPLKLVAIK